MLLTLQTGLSVSAVILGVIVGNVVVEVLDCLLDR